MAEFDVFHEFGKELEERIRLQTFPLAVKMLEKESDIPEKAQRPMRDFGYRLSSCQGFAISRREGTAVVTMFEDMWCPEAVVGFGLAEAPQYFFDGYHRFPQSVESLEAGRTLLLAAASKEGRELTCTVGSKGACVYAVVVPMQTGKYQVTVPCPGDRRRAACQPDEMIFSAPIQKIEELLTSLRYLEEYRYQLPFRYLMQPEGALWENYATMGRMMGMEWMK